MVNLPPISQGYQLRDRMLNRFEGADGIRGFACLIVLCVHAVAIFFNGSYMALAGTGKIGVWLFFVLSAFLLTSKFAKTGFHLSELLSYGIGRFLRIIPLYVIVVLLYFWLGTAGINSWQDVSNALLFKAGYAHLWTIPVEFKFYAILPLFAYLLLKAKQRGGQLGALGLAVAMIAAQQVVWPYWLTPESSISTHWYLSSFTIGCYFAVSMEFYAKHITAKWATVIGCAVVVLMILSSPIMRNILLDMPMDKWLQNKFVYLSLLWGFFVVALADGKGVFGAMLKTTIMRKLGAWSYSIYLVHWFFYIKYAQTHPNSVVWMFAGLVSAIVAGAMLHYLIESPIEKFRHGMRKRIRPIVTAMA